METLLDHTKNYNRPMLLQPEHANQHTYEDKFTLVEYLSHSAIVSSLVVLEYIFGIISSSNSSTDEQEYDTNLLLHWIYNNHNHVRNKNRSSTTLVLRFVEEERITSKRKEFEKKIVVAESEIESTHSSGVMRYQTTNIETTKVSKIVKEYQWDVEITYKLLLVLVSGGNDDEEEDTIIELNNSGNITSTVSLVRESTSSSQPPQNPPFQPSKSSKVFDLNLSSWLLQMISLKEPSKSSSSSSSKPEQDGTIPSSSLPSLLSSSEVKFAINRDSISCKTPRRNEDIQHALNFYKQVYTWSNKILSLLSVELPNKLYPYVVVGSSSDTTTKDDDDTSSSSYQRRYFEDIDTSRLFIPFLPVILEEKNNSNSTTTTSSSRNTSILSSMTDIHTLINHQKRTIDTEIESLKKKNNKTTKNEVYTFQEFKLLLLTKHLKELSTQYMDSIEYVEQLLRNQLVQAIGTEIVPEQFEQFMKYHNKRYFDIQYAPKPFSYAIRRPNHYPDGIISIERYNEETMKSEPIETLVRSTVPGGGGGGGGRESQPSIFIPINAATNVEIRGDRHLHGWMMHQWEHHNARRPQFVARAHQFSSFLVVIGVMGGPDTFLPKDAIVLQNKDEILIPLLTTPLPSAVEFRDAISSLSPEQKAFAQAFRAMQLGSSVFGVCVIQLKPQLERLLNLPDGALTKEIQLTQDLMSLFVDYQIPSDLLSYDDASEVSTKDMVAVVRGHVEAVLEVIDKAKAKQLEEEKRRAEMREEREKPIVREFSTMAYSSGPEATSSASRSTNRRAARQSYAPVAGPTASPSFSQNEAVDESFPTKSSGEYAGGEGGRNSAQRKANTSPKPSASSEHSSPSSGEDFTLLPKVLDEKLEQHEKSGSLRSTIIKTDQNWERKRQDNMLVPMETSSMGQSDISSEKNKAFDLLMAISRSGTLPIDASELHVVVAVSHCFENDLMGTVIEDNINPIQKVESSMLLVASVIHGMPPDVLVAPDRRSLPNGSDVE